MRTITVRCSPDPDDLFMMRALLEGRVETPGFTWDIDTAPTDALNRVASGEGADVVAISIAHYPRIQAAYQLLPHGGSVGEGYGPVLVAREPLRLDDLRGRRVAIPGRTTTAFTTLSMAIDVEPVEVPIVPYARTFEVLRRGEVDAALLIHEGRSTYAREGFHLVLDLGAWWLGETGLPLPLGGNCIRRSLGPDVVQKVSGWLRDAIADALSDREASIAWLLQRSAALATRDEVSTYLDWYANGRTLDYGEDGRAAVQAYLDRAAANGLLPPATVDWAP